MVGSLLVLLFQLPLKRTLRLFRNGYLLIVVYLLFMNCLLFPACLFVLLFVPLVLLVLIDFCWVQNQEHQLLSKFLMGLPDKLEWMHNKMFRQNQLPTSRAALLELLSEETCLGLLSPPGCPCHLAVFAASEHPFYLQHSLNLFWILSSHFIITTS